MSAFNDPVVLVKRLCIHAGKLSDDAVEPHLQNALRTLGSNISFPAETDEIQVVEKIKRKLARQHREKDAAVFAELHRKLQSQALIKNRWALLYLFLTLSDGGAKSKQKPMSMATLFKQGLGKHTTSTPLQRGQPSVPDTTTLASRHVVSAGSSGISSIQSGLSGDPSPIPQSFMPSFALTPAVNQTSIQPTEHIPKSVTVSKTKELPGKPAIPECVILRELVYAFQGIEGEMIKLDPVKEGYSISNQVTIPTTLRKTVHKLAECGWLFNKIRQYTDARSTDKAFGLVGQSFCAALHQELTEYYRLMAVLEAQLLQEQDQGVNLGNNGLTLRRLAVWSCDPLVRLKALAALVDISKGKKGGALASAVHSYIQHGDPFMRSLVKHTLTVVSQPVFRIIQRWIYDGELEDPFHEFFVASDPSIKDDQLWHDKYNLRKSMIPSFLSMEQARKILLTGKSINFLRRLCDDNTSIKGDVLKKVESVQADSMFTQDLDGMFQTMLDTVYEETSMHLLQVLHTKYKFMDHLKALRRYLLLGQGDFIRHLMDLLQEDLAKPVGTLYLHNLTGVLETAIRATNAQYDDVEILNRLDVRLLEVSPGDTGWDVFSLEYHVKGPIRTVFTPECMIMYLRVFNFLWRAKRMEYILAGLWKELMSHKRLLSVVPEMSTVLHQCHIISSEMIHFVQQVQYYINFEVLECSWDELLKRVEDAKDLDHIIAAHQEFLDSIITRALLDEQSRGILTQLRTIFDLIIQFQGIQNNLCEVGMYEMSRRQGVLEEQERRTKQGDWALTDGDEEDENEKRQQFARSVIPSSRAKLRVLAQSYQDMVQNFLVMLAKHSDVSLRFLNFRLDFNEYYKTKDPSLHSPIAYQKVRKRTT